MKILIVGAGAVGKVYGYHLNQAGVEVSFFVKEKYAEAARNGFTLFPRTRKAAQKTIEWKDFKVLTARDEVKKEHWDYVLLTMSSTALRTGWLEDFLQAIGSSPIISLQPGMFDQDYLMKRISPSRLISGTVSIMSYEAPLEGEKEEKPGTAFWIPPGSFSLFSGQPAQVDLFVDYLSKGGIPAKRVKNAHQENIIANVVLTLLVKALKQNDWSFEKFMKSPQLKLLTDAIPEAVAVQAKQAQAQVPKFTLFLKPFFFKGILLASPRLIPFNLEKYMRKHFTKVDDQMFEHLDQLIEFGAASELPTAKLEKFEAS